MEGVEGGGGGAPWSSPDALQHLPALTLSDRGDGVEVLLRAERGGGLAACQRLGWFFLCGGRGRLL